MRKLFSLFVTLLATTALWAHDFEVDGIYYNILSDTTVEVTYGGDSYWETYSADTIIIPSVVTYNGTSYSVVRIGSLAFYGCNISSITIPNSITSIGHNAFRYCRSLTTLIIPNGLESIEGGAFEECESLISITIPNSVTNIGGNAFYGTGVYNDLSNWENDVLYIGDCLISTKTSISGAYEIKNQTRLIADGTFNECKSLTAITFPENVTSIGDITFWECSSLKSVIWNVKNPKNCGITFFNTPISSFIFGENVAYIPAGLCQSMESLTSVIIPENVISIENAAFYGCSSLTSVTIGNSVTSIGSGAFSQCSSLTSITIPNSVTNIGEGAFYDCIFTKDNFVNNSTLDAQANNYWGAIIGDTELNGLLILNDTIIRCRSYVTSVTIPNSVTSIGNNAFSFCSSLTSVAIPNSVTSIGDYAFQFCSALISITIPNSVTSIGYYAFDACSGLTSLTIPESVTSIGEGAFECYNLTTIVVKDGNTIYDSRENCNAIIETATNTLVLGCQNTFIPNNVTRIGNRAFDDCRLLTSITIPNSVTRIGDLAFSGCSSLTSITIPNSVTSIGDRAFLSTGVYNDESNWENDVLYIDNCLIGAKESMSSTYTIKENTRLIAEMAFYWWHGLTSITIPESVTSIGDYAFGNCSSLTSVTLNSNDIVSTSRMSNIFGSQVEEYVIGNSVTSIGNNAFSYCSSLTSVAIPNSVTTIGNSAFAYCYSLTSVAIPNSVTTIRNSAFAYCSSLTSVTIPNSVTTIGGSAFVGCYSLTSITIPEGVTSIGSGAFGNCSSLKHVEWNVKNHTDFDYYNRPFDDQSSISIQSFTFGENVEYIPADLCYNMDSLKTITIPNSVDSIGEYAFAYCDSLTSVIIGNSVKKIGDNAFNGCSSLASITIPETVMSIGDDAFYDCFALKSVEWNVKNHADFGWYEWPFDEKSPISSFTFGENVEHIPAYICYSMDSLKSVTIPNNVDSIGEYAFAYCDSLTSVIIGNSVKKIGDNAFNGCSSLVSITIPETVMSIGDNAFYGCFALKSVEWNVKNHADFGWYEWPFDEESPIHSFTFGENVEYIPSYLCYNMDSLKTITIPNSVDSIGGQAFYSCDSLVSATIGNSVTSIGDYAFGNCSLLKYVEWNVKNYADFDYNNSPFRSSPAISSFTFGENVEYIPAYLCYNQDSLRSVTIPNSVDSIGEYAFAYCDSLTSVAIGESVSKVGEYAFFNDFIKTVFSTPLLPPAIESNVFGWKVYDNATLHVLSSDYKTHDVWKRFDSVQVADTIYSDGIRYKVITKSGELLSESLLTEESFNKFTRVSVEGTQTWRYDSQYGAKMSGFQDNVTHANEDWFISPALDLEGCSSATLTFSHAFGPKSSIPTTDSQKAQYTIWVSNDFEGDVNAATWTELKGMIYGDTGWGFVSSGDITIPTENLKGNCRVAWKYVCENSSATWEIKNVSLSATIDTNTKPTLQVINGESPYSGDIVIPSVVKYMNADLEVASIGNIAFRNCSSLNSVTIENGITTIEEYAFYNSSLTSIYLPNTLTNIGYSAFRGCSSLISIAIPNGVTTIRNNTFSGCSTLTSATISNRVMAIEKYAFADCSSLKNIVIPNSVARIGQSVFKNCTSMIEVTLSNEIITLEQETFQDCALLKSVKLGGKLTTIGEFVFSGCVKLNEITLPASVKSIEENAFAGCTKLYDIYCFAMEPPTAYESSFANYNAFLHVPCDNQRVYLLDVLFGNFKYIECIEAETTPTDTVVVTPSFNDAEFIWPSNSSADSYTLAISKDGEVFCTLTFNANGQLTGIAFAPSRNGQHNAPAAAQMANGFAFTVTGLNEGANYTYDLLIQDRSGNTLQSYSGEFRTRSVDDRTVMVEYDAMHGEVIGAGTYLLGDTVTLTATPNEGYQFVTWGDGNADNPRTLVVTQDTTLTALFEALTYNVMVTCDPIHGSVIGSGTYNHGDVATLTAIPNDGYRFVRWSNEVEDNPYTFIISDNVTLSAEFEVVIPSSLENTDSQSPTIDYKKILHNGQLLILRDGKTYNIMGQEI